MEAKMKALKNQEELFKIATKLDLNLQQIDFVLQFLHKYFKFKAF